MSFPRNVENMVASLRGLPTDRRRSRNRPLQGMDTMMDLLIAKYKIGAPSIEETIMRNWREIITPALASRCMPEKIDRDTLILRAANPVLRQEILFKQREILARLQKIDGCKDIRQLRFRG